METMLKQDDLSRYTVTLPPGDFLPRIQHHAEAEAQDEAYARIEKETGLTRDQLVHCWYDNDGLRTCVFVHRDHRGGADKN